MQVTQPKGMVSKETNKEAIARVFGLKKRQVGYLSTSAAVDSYTILYDEDTQTCWYRGTATGTPVSWTVTNKLLNLTTSNGSYVLVAGYSGDSIRQELGSSDGLKLVGRCSSVAALRTIEPTQNIQLIRTISYYAGLAPEMPRGGGDYEYDADPDDDQSLAGMAKYISDRVGETVSLQFSW